ncbi:type VII secretion protein EccB [Actinokineospora globicatena]|uniref:Type VII secretion protein EccB n=1 Tax=Actinokineospora globicatena TaxID=103729 RepID=A0A9W6QRC1_9PSEU|nr:type VII secretion protein EccB [Actinokineospora globicatena]MCP2301868.1 type VII secretion protein EccB [Actinokineospora globicatena]GLW76474.1 type VII secretion protein EccB [Actinokineospora globicatena]GLW83309.1 type VII secretion protein EccB [Actinokineospora globicatena]GLW94706.1 type VII secretion protein EccB [Actinokineospora globicatena]
MPSTPTTKSQVQAYRFVLRRMQSALVRKDAVMLHDPMRTHSRATVVGVCIAAVGVIGFLVYGLLSPAPKLPNESGIIIAKPSGAVYVLLTNTEKGKVLIPTFNLASARLLLLARTNPGAQGQPGSQTDAGGATEATPAEVIPDDKLVDIPRDRLTGIQDGPQLLPEPAQRVSADWAVCDEYKLDPSLNNQAADDKIETTVAGGVRDLGPELNPNEALLVKSVTEDTYLVYRTPATANIKNANTVRAKVDMSKGNILAALSLSEGSVRKITTGLLNAIPEAPELTPPTIPGRGERGQTDMNGLPVGSVVQVERAGQIDYYVVLTDGVQQIKKTTADLIRFTTTEGGAAITKVRPDQIPAASAKRAFEDKSFPEVVPEVLSPVNYPVACLGWNIVGDGPSADQHTEVHIGKELPLPRNQAGKPASVRVSTPSPDGQRLDYFYMPPGRAAVVRGATSRQDFATGPIYLISDRGVKFGIPDQRTAAALGLAAQLPAPDAIVRLLPNGASLNTRDVLQTYDTVPVGAGQFPSTTPEPLPPKTQQPPATP